MMDEYKNYLYSGGRAEGTVAQRIMHIEHLRREYPHVLACTETDLEAYLAVRRFQLKPETRKSIRASFKLFFKWAHRTGRVTTNPALELEPIHIPMSPSRVATNEQVEIAMANGTLTEVTAILLGRLAGLRLNEIATLHTGHREGRKFRVTGKGGKQRLVPINEELYRYVILLEAEVDGGYYFPGRWGGHIHKDALSKIIRRRLGSNPHSLRHAAATSAYENGGGDIKAVSEFLGHTSVATTQKYIHSSFAAVVRVADATTMRRQRHLSLVGEQVPDEVPRIASML